MSKYVIFEFRFPRIPAFHFRLQVLGAVGIVIGCLIMPLAVLIGQLSYQEPARAPVPFFADAKKITGTLHFGRGARDWRESELRLADGAAFPLRCKRFLASDACFNLKQGEKYEGVQATVWWDPDAAVLQLQIGNELIVRYADTVERFARPAEKKLESFLLSYFLFVAALLLVASRFTNVSIRDSD